MMNWIKFSKQKVNQLLRNLYVNGKTLVLFLGGESIHPSTKYAPLRSFRSLTELISRSTPRKYLLKSMLYGDPHQGVSRIQSFTSAKLFGWDLRVTYIYCFEKHLNKFFANKPIDAEIVVDEPVFLLPYYVTHFGHYTGEILGLLPLYAKLIKEMSLVGKRKLVYIEGDEDSQLMLSSFHLDDCCLKISPQMALDHTLIFTDAILLPLMHPWQNISFLKNSLSTHFPYVPTSTKKVFLTSYRTERITNLEELLEYLKLNNFEVVDARNCDVFTASKIRNADVLICEDGSISHMPLIHRNEKYFVLRSNHFKFKHSEAYYEYSEAHYAGGFIFTEFHEGLRIHVPCRMVKEQKHPLASRIFVDLEKLDQLLAEHTV